MDANAIALTSSCAAALGLSAGLGYRYLPLWLDARQQWRGLQRETDEATEVVLP